MPTPQAILTFWFHGVDDATFINKKAEPFCLWFTKNKKFDDEIRLNFENTLMTAGEGKLDDWKNSSEGRLALILLFDQFSRNIFRNHAKMFTFDSRALNLAREAVETKIDSTYFLIHRYFLFMPFMHAEDLAIQKMSVQCFSSLVDECQARQPQNVSYYQSALLYAQRHCDIIERFGRFPHRNQILNRVSSTEETAFLKTPGSGF